MRRLFRFEHHGMVAWSFLVILIIDAMIVASLPPGCLVS